MKSQDPSSLGGGVVCSGSLGVVVRFTFRGSFLGSSSSSVGLEDSLSTGT